MKCPTWIVQESVATVLTCALTISFVLLIPAAAKSQHPTIQMELRGRSLQATPLAITTSRVLMLARDGYLWDFSPDEPENLRKTGDQFRPFSQSEMRGTLLAEFGQKFNVSGTGNYLVVHPAGQRDQWAPRFEALFRSFQQYFSVRGMRTERPMFPLVAVVFPTKQDFMRQAAREGAGITSNTLGYYSTATNRILLYDVTAGQADSGQWHVNAETIIHEAVHQCAFNSAVHSRYADTPRWIAEGLGTLFEAPGVWNARENTRPADRINRGRLADFKQYANRRSKGSLAAFVSSDRLFETNGSAAYAEAWALSYFLAEQEPRKYTALLAKTARKPAFQKYTAPERLKDFSDICGGNLAMLEARFLRFMEGVK